MGDVSDIDWLYHPLLGKGASLNPTTGCDRVSKGCDECYALKAAARMKRLGQPRYQLDGDPRTSGPGFGLTLHPETILDAVRWKRPRLVFVDSMSDLFHPRVPDWLLARMWCVMAATPHVYIILTKRPARMASLLNHPRWARTVRSAATAVYGSVGWGEELHAVPRAHLMGSGQAYAEQLTDDTYIGRELTPLPNVWLGVSVEDADVVRRVELLTATPAAVRVVSAEPLLGPVDLSPYKDGIDWLIVGGESGDHARPAHPDWIENLCRWGVRSDIPTYFKQWGSWSPLPPAGTPMGGGITLANDGTAYQPGDLVYPDGPRYGEAVRANHQRAHLYAMYRHRSKASAGHTLNTGETLREHPPLPAVTLAAAGLEV